MATGQAGTGCHTAPTATDALKSSTPAVRKQRLLPRLSDIARSIYPGFTVCLTIALAAFWLSQHYPAPVQLFALLIGLAFNFLRDEPSCAPGIQFTSRSVLRVGVALLGVRITLAQIESLGIFRILTVLVGVISTGANAGYGRG
jgi:uncharacterized membrane protein YadS